MSKSSMTATVGATIQYKGDSSPLVLKKDRVLFCDVDDTLITFNFKSEDQDKCLLFGPIGFEKAALPMQTNIDNLKNARTRGHGVVVWSQGGHEWATEVISKLGLNSYVDFIVTKPSWIYDDLPAEAWMPHRFYTPAYPEDDNK